MQQTLEISQQEVDVQRSLMGFVDDNRIVLVEKTVGLSFRQQDPVRHQTNSRIRTAAVGKANSKTDFVTKSAIHLLSQSRGDGASGDSTRLGMPDDSAESSSHFNQDFGQLSRLAGSCFTAQHHDLIVTNRVDDFLLASNDWEFFIPLQAWFPDGSFFAAAF